MNPSRTPATTRPTTAPVASPSRKPTPRLRLIPGEAAAGPQQLALAYEWEVAPGVPAVPDVPVNLHLVGEPATPDADISGLPDPRKWAAQLARAVAEVSMGERPAGQLTRWVAREELAKLARHGTFVARHPSARAHRGVSRRRVVRAVRVCLVAPGVLETSAVLVGAERAQAVAIRLEAIGGRWLATVVEIR